MSRYDIPDPKCSHKPKGRVSGGDLAEAGASTYVCDRPACIEDAKEWVWASCHQRGEFVAFKTALARLDTLGADAGKDHE